MLEGTMSIKAHTKPIALAHQINGRIADFALPPILAIVGVVARKRFKPTDR
jgi:hypothetical protein